LIFVVIPGLIVGGSRLRERCFGSRYLGSRLTDAAFRIDFRLVYAKPATLFLCLENADLLLRTANASLCRLHRRFGCVFTRSHLVIVEHGDHIAGSHNVTLAETNLANASCSLGRDSCFVAGYPSRGDNKVLSTLLRGPVNEDVPDQEGDGRDDDREENETSF
jgi:hypothetical protein